MTVDRSGLIVFAVFVLGFSLVIEAGNSGDLLVRGTMLSVVLLASGYEIARLWRGDTVGSDWTASLPSSVRRWLLGER